MTDSAWRKFVPEADIERANNTELTNQIDYLDISHELDGYGWQPDRQLTRKLGLDKTDDIDPICCIVLEGILSYLELCGGAEHDELHYELDHAFTPVDVIKDDHGFATRFKTLDALDSLAKDVIDFLVTFYFASRGFGITIEVSDNDKEHAETTGYKSLLFRLNPWRVGRGIAASILQKQNKAAHLNSWKVHNLAANGLLLQLKTRGNLICPFCSKPAQVRVPLEAAEALSVWEFNPTEANRKLAFASLTGSEREVLVSGIHPECWPSSDQ